MLWLYSAICVMTAGATFFVGYYVGWKDGCHRGMSIANGIWEALHGPRNQM